MRKRKKLRVLATALPLLILSRHVVAAASLNEAGLSVETGYRLDNLVWNIAGNNSGTNPNILSELTWSDVGSYYQKVEGFAIIKTKNQSPALALRGHLGYGSIFAGDNQDSDYDGDDRTLEYSRSNNKCEDGAVFDNQLGVGTSLMFAQGKMFVSPFIGWSYHAQNLTITDGGQTISVPPQTTPLGEIAGLDSSYDARWYGLWAGADFSFRPTTRLSVDSTMELHVVDYFAEGKWNLRSDITGFEHDADSGLGVVFTLGGQYRLTNQWSLNLDVGYQEWKVEEGTHTVFLTDGSAISTRLNEVTWDASSAMFGVTYRFK